MSKPERTKTAKQGVRNEASSASTMGTQEVTVAVACVSGRPSRLEYQERLLRRLLERLKLDPDADRQELLLLFSAIKVAAVKGPEGLIEIAALPRFSRLLAPDNDATNFALDWIEWEKIDLTRNCIEVTKACSIASVVPNPCQLSS